MFDRRFLLFAAALLLFPYSARAADAEKPAKTKALVAHIKLSGGMDEKAPSFDPLLGVIGETFKAKIDRLKKAKNDKDVQAVLLEIDGLAIGWGKRNELAEAIASIRAAGKKVYAHLESGNQGDYLLALACDEICVTDASWVMLVGLRAEAMFYKGMFEKLGIKADMLQMGDFKGAAEPYTRESLSEANRKQLTSVLDDYFDNELVARVVKGRKKKRE